MKLQITNWKKENLGQVDLPDSIFAQPVRRDLMKDYVVWQLACRRSGTHKTKTRAYVRGGGKKPFKQKGTGNARQGTSRSPLMPGGAILFGPQPRDYSYVLPKKVKRAALKSVLSLLAKENKLFIFDDLSSKGKTSEFAKNLKSFGVQKALLIDNEVDVMVKRATSNLAKVKYFASEGLNVYDALKYDTLIVTKKGLDALVKRLGSEA